MFFLSCGNSDNTNSSQIRDDGAGTLTQTCGVLAYEPSTHFCDVGTSAPLPILVKHLRSSISGPKLAVRFGWLRT